MNCQLTSCHLTINTMRKTILIGMSVLFGGLLLPATGFAQSSYEREPIRYSQTPADDPVSRLQEKVNNGEVTLDFDDKNGWLVSILEHLNAPQSSQMLVFSKTSIQHRRISPRAPRAVYFADDVYIGWVQGSDIMEFAAVDPKQGAIFYTLKQRDSQKPKFTRLTHECTQCHGSSLTREIPGHIVRSVYPAPDGYPILSAGSFVTNHESPIKERWGGWYVTGRHGDQTHLGNLLVRGGENDPDKIENAGGQNVTDLSDRFYIAPYLTEHSDIVALMVMEHQAQLHNLITRAGFETRRALYDEKALNKFFERAEGFRSDTTIRRIKSVAEPLLKYILYVDEAKLTGPIEGTTSFAKDFASMGPRDDKNRSLRDFDLKRRMFKYPCSYLIYSEAFDKLPEEVTKYVYRRLHEVLTGKDTSKTFSHLSSQDRQAILEILVATKPNLPDYFKPVE